MGASVGELFEVVRLAESATHEAVFVDLGRRAKVLAELMGSTLAEMGIGLWDGYVL